MKIIEGNIRMTLDNIRMTLTYQADWEVFFEKMPLELSGVYIFQMSENEFVW